MTIQRDNTVLNSINRPFLAAGFLIASLFALPGAVQADNMMSACEAEIASACNGVREGRGRIAACLYANNNKLSAACKTEVDTVSSSRTFQRYLPTDGASLQGSDAALKEACTADADKVCTGVQSGGGRMLACIYARSKTVSKACSTAAEAILN